MRTAQTVLTVIQERGKQHKPIERVYKLLFNRDFYLNAYAKLYPNNGAMTKGVTDETVDGMSIQKIDRMIELLREEKYQWKPARREYIPKKNGKKRPLGIPAWGDKRKAIIEDKPYKVYGGRTELVKRLLADTCELCGSKENIEVHHIRKLADVKNKGLLNAPTWAQVMAARNRKTLVVCRECHVAIHNGTINKPLS